MLIFSNGICAKESSVLPRFASIKASEVNARTGPNLKYPISWVYIKKGEPVEIIAEFEQWKKIRDYKHDEAWVHETMVSNKRFVIIAGDKNINVYNGPNDKKSLFIVEPNLRALLIKCRAQFCEIKIDDHSGWVSKSQLWGIYDQEEYN
jgi:SH3-like domain-containing protein